MSERVPSAPLAPGSTVGILGSGQLGRMLSLAAARLGLTCHIYSDVAGSAMDVAVAKTIAPYSDTAALAQFAGLVDCVTYEFENVPLETARFLETLVPLRPGSRALEVAQDRLAEKTFLAGLGLAVAPFANIETAADLTAKLAMWQRPAILKSRRLGYDGKGQTGIAPGDDATAALASLGHQPMILEQRLSFAAEYSVLLVRSADGAALAYDIPRNAHKQGILDTSTVPGGLSQALASQAVDIARCIAAALDYVGLLSVELFDLGSDHAEADRLIVNEIAPRVHNSGHWTLEACPISQFENHIRAVAGWPLGSCDRHSDAVMTNLIGTDANAWLALASDPTLALHLYGKGQVRPGRKMGHLTRLGAKTQ